MSRRVWNMADQGVSAVVSFLLVMLVAQRTSAAAFGTFALVYGYYVFVLQMSQSMVSEPLLVRFPGTRVEARRAIRLSVGSAACLGVVGSAALLPVGLLVFGGLPAAALVLMAVLPFLLVQDAYRMAFIAEGRPRVAFATDLFWGVTQCVFAVAALQVTGELAWVVAAWAASGVLTAGLSAVLARTAPWPLVGGRPALTAWRRDYGDLADAYLAEAAALAGSVYAALLLAETFAGLAAAGALRAAQTLFGPANVLMNAVRLVAIAELSRAAREGRPLTRHVHRVGGALGAAGLLAGLVVMVLPDGVGRALFGASWAASAALLPALTVHRAATGLSVGPLSGLRALQRVRPLFALRIGTAAATVAAAAAGAVLGGAEGVAWGMAAVMVVSWLGGLVLLAGREGTDTARPPAAAVGTGERGAR